METKIFAEEKDDIIWITVAGRHIPIKKQDIKDKPEKGTIKVEKGKYIGNTKVTPSEWKEATHSRVKAENLLQKLGMEGSAISSFTGEDYMKIRVAQTPELKEVYRQAGDKIDMTNMGDLKERADALQNFIKDAPKYEGTIYRNITIGKNMDKKFSAFKKGMVIESEAITSYSKKTEIGDEYSKTKIIIKNNKSGVYLGKISQAYGEDEVIIPKGVKLQFQKIEKRKIGKDFVQTRYVFKEI